MPAELSLNLHEVDIYAPVDKKHSCTLWYSRRCVSNYKKDVGYISVFKSLLLILSSMNKPTAKTEAQIMCPLMYK